MAKSKTKTTWSSHDGTMSFFMPNRTQHQVPVQEVDRPNTLCEIVDTVVDKLSPHERRVLARLLALLEPSQPEGG